MNLLLIIVFHTLPLHQDILFLDFLFTFLFLNIDVNILEIDSLFKSSICFFLYLIVFLNILILFSSLFKLLSNISISQFNVLFKETSFFNFLILC